MNNVRRRFIAALLLFVTALGVGAQPYPSKPIKFVVPFTPGGSNDVLARVIGEKLSAAWGQPVIVENRPGAAGNIGAEVVAKAPPDGYTFLVAANNILAINPSLLANVPFDPVKSFAPVTLIGTVPVVLVVHPSVPAGSAKELIALAKTKPGSLSYASSGSGSPQHLAGEMFKSMAGIDVVHVPYKGAGPAVADLIGGQVQMLVGPVNSVLPHIKAGKLKALGAGTAKRIPALPDVPTIAESAVPGYETDIWISLVAPVGTPSEIVARMNAEIGRIFQMPDVREKLAAQGIEPVTSSPERLASLITSDLERWAKVIRSANIKAE